MSVKAVRDNMKQTLKIDKEFTKLIKSSSYFVNLILELHNLEQFSSENISIIANKYGFKLSQVYMILRLSVTGKKAGADLFKTIKLLPIEKVKARLMRAYCLGRSINECKSCEG